MKFFEKLMVRDEKLYLLTDIFTIVYIVSLYIFAGGHEHFQQSYSNVIALFYIYLLCCYAYKHRSALFQNYTKLYIPFMVLCGLSCFWSWDRPYGIKLTAELFAMFVLAVLMCNYIVTEEKIDIMLYGFYIGGVCLMFGTVLYYGIPGYFKGLVAGERMGHILGNLNDEGVHTAYSALIALFFCLYRRKWMNFIPFICLFVYAMGSQSKKVFIVLALGVFLLVFMKKGWKYKVFSVCAVLLISLMFLYLPLFKGVTIRIQNALGLSSGGRDYSTTVRMEMIKQALIQIKKTPVFGIGLGGSHVLLKRTVDFDSYSHINYLEIMLIMGVTGFIFWYCHYLFTFKTFVKRAFCGNGIAILMLTFMLMGLVVHFASVEYQERFQIILVMFFFAVKEIGDRETAGKSGKTSGNSARDYSGKSGKASGNFARDYSGKSGKAPGDSAHERIGKSGRM